MQQNVKNKGCRAFTLAELLVVISVIGILAALLLPALVQSKRKAQQAQCISNLHQLGVAMQMFVGEYNCYPTWGNGSNTDLPDGWWAVQLERGGFGILKPEPDFYQKGVWRCPSAQARSGNIGTSPYYGLNVFGVLPVGNLTNFGLGGHLNRQLEKFRPIRESEVAVPAAMMAIGESDAFAFMRAEGYDFYHHSFRHLNRVDVLFCDGHVDSPTLQFLFENTSDEALARWNRDHLPHREMLYYGL